MNRMDAPPESIEGVLERITYANEENGWSVVRIAVSGRRDPVTAVGNLLGVQPGESLRLHGRWNTDRRFGEQFRVDSYVTIQPATLVGIEKYLGSGLVRGIGKIMAARMVERFGIETLEVIEFHSERLTEVEGIGPVRRDRILRAWREQRDIKEVMLFLQSHGVSTAHAIRIYKEYGERAIAVVRDDPYRLALDIFGIGFKTADRIATAIGIPRDAPRRAEAGILHVLAEYAGEGNVYAPRRQLLHSALEILEIEDSTILDTACEALAAAGRIVIAPAGGGDVADHTTGDTTTTGHRAAAGDSAAEDDPAVYLRSLHVAETGVAAAFAALLRSPPTPIQIDFERAIAWFERDRTITLAPGQREAIRRAILGKVVVVTGGPGTGKTTLVNGLIRILEKKGMRILLAAPTGRAAKRMTEATGREAKTIHRLLEFSPKGMRFERDAAHPLEADIVIVDEFSMVDIVLAYDLLKAVPISCRLVLVGDVDQLPSVGPGDVLREVIGSGRVDVVRLETIFRQAEESRIVVNAHRINRGEMPLPEDEEGGDFYFVERKEPEEVLEAIQELVARRIPRRFGFHPIDGIQVLTPMHRGLLGATSLNGSLQSLLNPRREGVTRGSRSYLVGDKVIQLRNNYDLDVFNGDIGRLESWDPVEQRMEVRFDERLVRYDYSDLDELALAYACSIHKAQGSEFPCVVIPLHTQHYVMLQRNLLYTAITRGKRLVVIVGTKRALAIAVRNARPRERFTLLGERMREAPQRTSR